MAASPPVSVFSRLLTLLLVVLGGLWLASGTVHAATFLVINTNDNGLGSLRQAILDAEANNNEPTVDNIQFNLPGVGVQTITPLSALPVINEPVVIDGLSQPGTSCAVWPPVLLIELDLTAANDTGLEIGGNDSVIAGLVINDFTGQGIDIGVVANRNTITCNFIGTDPIGMIRENPNGDYGILVGGDENYVGPVLLSTQGNLIAGEGFAGIRLLAANANTIQGNSIGVNAARTLGLGVYTAGILIQGNENQIGGTSAGQGNLLAGNTYGIQFLSAMSNTIQGNLIGLALDGQTVIGNSDAGIRMEAAVGNLIGGEVAGARNLIGGNGTYGIHLTPDMLGSSSNNVIQQNYIGVDAGGTATRANNESGIYVEDGTGLLIGGTTSLAGNLISGNVGAGILMTSGSSDTTIQGNFIGTTANGESALPNQSYGISIQSSLSNTVGGPNAGEGNVISGNGLGGVQIWTGNPIFEEIRGNVVAGNRIGTNQAGTLAMGNGGDGVLITGAAISNTIGGVVNGAGNLISANAGHGVYVTGSAAENNLIYGNQIGTTADGSGDLGNGGDGARLENSAPNHVGGLEAAMGNTLAYNGGNGVSIVTSLMLSWRKAILRNSIFANDALGIDLIYTENNVLVEGVTPNDVGDGDDGPNMRQNFPVLTSAQNQGNQFAIQGTLSSAADTTYRIEFFAQTVCDASGYGEGEQFLGAATATTGADGVAAISVTLPLTQPVGTIVTTTATDPENNTSEFSACLAVINAAPIAQDDQISTTVEIPITINVLANDQDSDGDPLTITSATDPANGTVVINGGIEIAYTPNAGFEGVDTFTYSIADGRGGVDSALVTVTVSAPTHLPEVEPPGGQDRDLFLPNITS